MSSNLETVWEPKSENVIRDMLELKEKYQIGDLRAIELYGGDGHTLSNKMAEESVSFIGYDINPEKEEGFKKNVVNGEFRCGDSVKLLTTMQEGEIGTFNLISTDAPICCYGENYCEHFEILNYVYKLMKKGEKVLCVFPVVPKPYDTDKAENGEWMKRRAQFYGTEERDLDLDKTFGVYDALFENQNLQVLERRYTCREYRNGVDWMYEYMYVAERR